MQTPLRDLIQSHGHAGFYRKVVDLLNEKQLTPDDFSYYELAAACGVLPKLKGLRESRLSFDARLSSVDATSHLLSETSSSVGTTLFQVVTGELISRKVLEGYEDQTGFIGDKLVTVLPSKVRNARIAGFKALGGPTDVNEGQPYDESTFAEKFVTTAESKQGRILSITEELIGFDQTGEIHRRAMALGYYLRQERERTIVRAVTDADATTGTFVYRPAGTGQTLYNANGTNRNYVGPGNTTSTGFNAAIPLHDWTNIEDILHYRRMIVAMDQTIDVMAEIDAVIDAHGGWPGAFTGMVD